MQFILLKLDERLVVFSNVLTLLLINKYIYPAFHSNEDKLGRRTNDGRLSKITAISANTLQSISRSSGYKHEFARCVLSSSGHRWQECSSIG